MHDTRLAFDDMLYVYRIDDTLMGVMQKHSDYDYDKYSLQLNIYKYVLEQSDGVTIRDMFLIRADQHASIYQKTNVCNMQEEVRRLFAPLSPIPSMFVTDDPRSPRVQHEED